VLGVHGDVFKHVNSAVPAVALETVTVCADPNVPPDVQSVPPQLKVGAATENVYASLSTVLSVWVLVPATM